MPNEFLSGYLPYLLQRADQVLSVDFHQELIADGIAVSEWRVLAILSDGVPRLVGDLAEIAMLPQPTTTHALDRLEQSGSVVRERVSADGRRRNVRLTATGHELADRLISSATAHQSAALGSGDRSADHELVAEFRRVIDELTARHAHSD